MRVHFLSTAVFLGGLEHITYILSLFPAPPFLHALQSPTCERRMIKHPLTLFVQLKVPPDDHFSTADDLGAVLQH